MAAVEHATTSIHAFEMVTLADPTTVLLVLVYPPLTAPKQYGLHYRNLCALADIT